MNRIWQDCRYAFRTLRNSPWFAASAVLVVALGIGANNAVFSLLDALLLKPLAIQKPGDLVGIYQRDAKHPDSYRAFSYPDYVDLRQNPAFSGVMAHMLTMVGAGQEGSTRRTFADVVSSNYFSTLGVPLFKGRPFREEDEKAGTDLSAIVTYSFWSRNGQDPHILGKTLRINGHQFSVIGVTPKDFTGLTALFSPEVFLPLGAYELVISDAISSGGPLAARNNRTLILVGRLNQGVTEQAADAAMAVAGAQLEKAFPAENKDQMLLVRPLSRLALSTNPTDDRAMRVPAILLLSLTLIVLLIASLNVANMMMARGVARRKEIAIRIAIGGNRNQIVQQLVMEALVLGMIASAAGLLLSSVGTTLLVSSLARLAPLDLVFNPAPDALVLAATTCFCCLSAIIFGLFPAWQLSKLDSWVDLKENAGEDVSGRSRSLFSRSNLLVMAQLSLSLMMLAAAGLFVRSALSAADVHPGFSLDHQVVAELDASLVNYDETRGRDVYRRLEDRLGKIPGVQTIALAATVPFGLVHLAKTISSTDGHPPLDVRFNVVSPDYFQTLEIPLLRGRTFVSTEGMAGSGGAVAIVDELAAQKLWRDGDALGKYLRFDNTGVGGHSETCRVVGVVGNVRESIFGGKPQPHVYAPFRQEYHANMHIHLKLAGMGPEAEGRMLETVRREIRATDEALPLLALRTMRGNLESSAEIWIVRTGARMLGIFGSVALFLAVIGLYAVSAQTVARRTREIGIRMALGANSESVRRMILGESLRVIAVGVGIGLALSIGIGRLLANVLYDIHSTDPVVLTVTSLILISVALFASYMPARRASRVDPLIALRSE